ncbi:MAG: YCF48-related protein, partial [Actinomycetes bacterium]
VWRFRSKKTLYQYLWTADATEKSAIIARSSDTWALEGVAFTENASASSNRAVLWRLRNRETGSYFYTSDSAELASIVNARHSKWTLEGPACNVPAVPTLIPVWRFRSQKTDAHFWSADPAERESIQANSESGWTYEGIAYYIDDVDAAHAVGWVVGSSPKDGYGVILHTTDGGTTWLRQGSASDVPSISLCNVKAVDRYTAWAVGWPADGYGAILHTTDGGQSWVRQGSAATIPNVAVEGITVVGSQTVWVSCAGGFILRSDDAGQTWAQQTSGTTTTLFEIAAVNSQEAWAAGDEQDGYAIMLHTSDGGVTWERQGTAATMGDAFIDLTAADGQTAWGVGPNQWIAHTADGGLTWQHQSTYGLDHVNGACAVNSDIAWAAVDYNRVLRTTNGGATWNDVPLPAMRTAYLLGISAPGPNAAWAVGGAIDARYDWGVIVRTTDAGKTWQVQSTPLTDVTFRRISFVGSHK